MRVTEPVYAIHVEAGDVVLAYDVEYTVYDTSDDGDYILLIVKDDDGDVTELPFGPFDTVTVVTAIIA